jgi:hypothetical protein
MNSQSSQPSPQLYYRFTDPVSQQPTYTQNGTVDFVVKAVNEKLTPSFALTGDVTFFHNQSTGSKPTNAQEILFDPEAGFHSLFKSMIVTSNNQGVLESVNEYPQLVKMTHFATVLRDSLGTETMNAVEGVCTNETVAMGMAKDTRSFVLLPKICLNTLTSAMSDSVTGDIKIRIQLAPNREVLYGEDASSASGYSISNLRLLWRSYDDDKVKEPVALTVYGSNQASISTNLKNLSTFAPLVSDSVKMCFIPTAELTDYTKNFLRMSAPPSVPLNSTTGNATNYGFNSVNFMVNDTGTGLTGFEFTSEEEILWNALRSFNNEPKKFAVTPQSYRAGREDGYMVGMNFGKLIDFKSNKFQVTLSSAIQTAFTVRLFFRGQLLLVA